MAKGDSKAAAVVADVKSDEGKIVSEIETELKTLEGDAVTDADEAGHYLATGFGLVGKVHAAWTSAVKAVDTGADKALSELHAALADLRSKLAAAEQHVSGDVSEFIASLKSHL